MPSKTTSSSPGDASPAKRQRIDQNGSKATDAFCINTIRCLSADMPEAAKSGHPGAPIGCAPMTHVLWSYVMKYSPSHPTWINRDRFVLSNGHACALLYALLHLTGYDVSMEELQQFRKLNSKTPGHPESFLTPGVEVCTGPLGQGIANAVGMAIAAKHLAAKYNKPKFPLFDNFVYCICGDGCLQEGISAEASSLAGHLGLGHLIVLYDDNKITIDGSTEKSFTEDITLRYQAYGWDVRTVEDGNTDWEAILKAVQDGKQQLDKPTLIRIHTSIGYGSIKEGSEKVHGAPLGADALAQLKQKFGFDPTKSFYIPPSVLEWYRSVGGAGQRAANDWEVLFAQYKRVFSTEGEEVERRLQRSLPPSVMAALPVYALADTPQAGRAFSGQILNYVAKNFPDVMGGSADLTSSNATALSHEAAFQRNSPTGRYLHFGVREHAMAAICNGLASYGGIRPFCATFLNFLTYAWGAVRLSALGRLNVLYIATHDSIELGEDGPTHQAIETLALLRATPNLLTFRPADGNEVSSGYSIWLESTSRPLVMALCRGPVPILAGSSAEKAKKGAYILSDFNDSDGKKILLASSGSEVCICAEAKELLITSGYNVRLVSFPCWELFEEQSKDYQQSIMMMQERRNGEVKTVYVEAASPFGWDKYFDVHIGMTTFGASAAKKFVYEHFGFTKENIADKAAGAYKQNSF